jgi:hypothetical protein
MAGIFLLMRYCDFALKGGQMPKIEQLLKGFGHFRENYFEKDRALFQ